MKVVARKQEDGELQEDPQDFVYLMTSISFSLSP